MSNLQLRPCPFCGRTRINLKGHSNVEGHDRPSCDACGASAPSIKVWNTRIKVWDTRTAPEAKTIYYTEEGVAVSGEGLEHLRLAPKLQE